MKKFLYFVTALVFVSSISGCVTYVRPAPPPVQAEVVGAAPYPAAIWVRGHWAWKPRLGTYIWIPGHWRPAY